MMPVPLSRPRTMTGHPCGESDLVDEEVPVSAEALHEESEGSAWTGADSSPG